MMHVSGQRHPGARAFTLIEVLVVVAIIALLAAILLPSLGAAREQARTAVCASNLHQQLIALGMYTAEERGYLPGPNTSGIALADPNYVFRNNRREPTQNMDWVSPMLGHILQLPEDREQRMLRIFEHDLSCPSNKEKYADQYTGSGANNPVTFQPRGKQYSSYSASLGFHLKPDYDAFGNPTGFSGPIFTPPEASNVVHVPNSFQFRMDDVGIPAIKVFVMEGARYVDNGVVTFNPFTKQIRGGNFMDFGPTISIGGTPFRRGLEDTGDMGDLKLTADARRFAYRHRDKFNVIFFDGHVETMHERESLKMKYWWPKGSVILNSAWSKDPSDWDGQVIH